MSDYVSSMCSCLWYDQSYTLAQTQLLLSLLSCMIMVGDALCIAASQNEQLIATNH